MSKLTMIRMKVQHERHSEEISFPCSDKELYDKMVELRLPQPSVAKAYVSEVLEPEELGLIHGDVVDLDEVNYLAKRMESFWGNEYWQFLEAARLEGFTQLKDLINLSFNLDKYTLIQDISDMGKVGREYVLNTQGAVPANDANDPKYAKIGWQVLQTGKGVFTEHGFLVKDRDKPLEELYNGKNFPPYLYQECVVVGEIQYDGNTEYVFLPDDELVIDKALARLELTIFTNVELNWKIIQLIKMRGKVLRRLSIYEIFTKQTIFSMK